MHKIKVIASTSTPAKNDTSVTDWIMGLVQQDRGIHAEFLDLAEVNLPTADEAIDAQAMEFQHEHAKKWSASITESDAFIIVLEEYGPGCPVPIKNALYCLYHEWKYKPVAFVSYGEVTTGSRSIQTLKQMVKALGMMPISEAVTIPLFPEDEANKTKFLPKQLATRSAHIMLSELKRWSIALKGIRNQLN